MTALDGFVLAAYGFFSLLAFALMGVDKYRARRKLSRIRERTLLLSCACFGALGGWLGMHAFSHKTRHAKFFISVPVMLLLQAALLTLYFVRWRA